jgi:integrase
MVVYGGGFSLHRTQPCGNWTHLCEPVKWWSVRCPIRRATMTFRLAGVAQLVEQPIRNRQVIGSSPIAGSSSFKRLLLHSRKDRAWVMVVVMLDTGLRISEVRGLERQHVDLERLTLRVLGKGRKERFVPMSTELRKHLWRWLQHAQRHCSSGRFVFSTRHGGRLSYRNAYRNVRAMCQALGISTHPPRPPTLLLR